MPVYQLLGGASRNGLMAYGHASGKTNDELFDSIRSHLEQGYRSIRVCRPACRLEGDLPMFVGGGGGCR